MAVTDLVLVGDELPVVDELDLEDVRDFKLHLGFAWVVVLCICSGSST